MKSLYEDFDEKYKNDTQRNFFITHSKFLNETEEMLKQSKGRPAKLFEYKG